MSFSVPKVRGEIQYARLLKNGLRIRLNVFKLFDFLGKALLTGQKCSASGLGLHRIKQKGHQPVPW